MNVVSASNLFGEHIEHTSVYENKKGVQSYWAFQTLLPVSRTWPGLGQFQAAMNVDGEHHHHPGIGQDLHYAPVACRDERYSPWSVSIREFGEADIRRNRRI